MSVFKELRNLSRREATLADMEEFLRQVRLEENDRGSALLVATNADLALTAALHRVLHASEESKDEFEKPGGPLQNFSQRITMGRALRIYGPETEYNLTLLRMLRNTFAHAHVPITFETQEVAAAIDLFRVLPLRFPFNAGADATPAPSDPRGKFHHHCEILSHNLVVWGAYGVPVVMDGITSPGLLKFAQPEPMP